MKQTARFPPAHTQVSRSASGGRLPRTCGMPKLLGLWRVSNRPTAVRVQSINAMGLGVSGKMAQITILFRHCLPPKSARVPARFVGKRTTKSQKQRLGPEWHIGKRQGKSQLQVGIQTANVPIGI
jgi:hypothetical protein